MKRQPVKATLASMILGVLLVPNAPAQSLLCEAHLDLSLGAFTFGIVNSVNVIISITNDPSAVLFTGLSFGAADAGRTYTIGPGTDPGFAAFVNHLTDGKGDPFGWGEGFPGGAGAGSYNIPPTKFWTTLPPANAIDLAGYTVDSMSLRFATLQFSSQPNWTQLSCDAFFSVYGQPIPEPGSLVLLLVGGLAPGFRACARLRH